jgi:hypothetical protein
MISFFEKMNGERIYMCMMGGVCLYDVYDSVWRHKSRNKIMNTMTMIWLYGILWNVSKDYWKYGMIYLIWDIGNEYLTASRNKFIKN